VIGSIKEVSILPIFFSVFFIGRIPERL